MLALKNLVASAVLATVMPAIAAPIFLDFEDSPLEPVQAGKSYENKFGVIFTDNAYTMHSTYSLPQPGNGGNFHRYGDSSKAALFMSSSTGVGFTDFYINVAAGFADTFRMLYTSTQFSTDNTRDTVELFSGENGGGIKIVDKKLKKVDPCRDSAGDLKPSRNCDWREIKLDFTGTAKSVHITGASSFYFFDNMTFGPLATPPGIDVPEPGGIALSLAALGALAWTRKRYQR